MATYTVNFTDPNKAPITILRAAIDGPGYSTRSTDLVLVGQNRIDYGELQQENFIHLLEHFAHNEVSPNQPNPAYLATPTKGQAWYNNTTNILHLYDGAAWRPIKGAITSATQPFNPVQGDLWFDTTQQQLKVYNGSSYVSVADSYIRKDGTTVLTGNFNLGNFNIINLANPVNPQDAVNYGTTESRYLRLTGGTLGGNLTLPSLIVNRVEFGGSAVTYQQGTILRIASAQNSYTSLGYELTPGNSNSFTEVVRVDGNSLRVGNIQLSAGAASFGSLRLSSVADPTNAQDAATKAYVDASSGATSGSKLGRGTNSFWDGENRILSNLANPVSTQDAVTKTYQDTAISAVNNSLSLKLGRANSNPSSYYDANGLYIQNLPAPILQSDAANKAYVDAGDTSNLSYINNNFIREQLVVNYVYSNIAANGSDNLVSIPASLCQNLLMFVVNWTTTGNGGTATNSYGNFCTPFVGATDGTLQAIRRPFTTNGVGAYNETCTIGLADGLNNSNGAISFFFAINRGRDRANILSAGTIPTVRLRVIAMPDYRYFD